jgi:flagellar motility protein MotE (MotC chaperone)
MKPKDAAAIFESMDVTFAAGFLARMNRDAAARLMAGLSAEKAYSISVVMAGRNARAPTR